MSQPGTDDQGVGLLKPLLPLALATFAVGTDAFVIAGLLPAIADDIGVGVPAAGQLVSVFALTLAITAPVLSWLLSSFNRRVALQVALAVFIIGNIATALSPNFPIMMSARILTALGAASITASASSAAVVIAPEARRGKAMALVIGGLTLATALGMPLGNLIGSVDWRLTLWAVAGLGLLAVVGISAWLPKVSLPTVSLTARLAPLGEGRVLAILAATALVMAGHYTLYTYIGPITEEARNGRLSLALTTILFAWGLGLLLGNFLAGHWADRRSALTVALAALGGGTVLLAVSPFALGQLEVVLIWALAWGATDGMASVVQQHRLVAIAPASAPLLFGLNSSAIYVGVAIGGALGGLSQEWFAITLLGVPAASMALLATLVTIANRGRSSRPGPAQ